MNKTILLVLATTGVISSTAQRLNEKEVPANVKEAFAKTNPDIKNAEWEKEGANFEVEFKVKNKEKSLVYDANGILLETEVEISEKDLPSFAKEYISKNYGGRKIKEATKITSADGKVFYEAGIDKKDLIFDADGTLIRTETRKEDKN